jgi:hypothetical protein
VEWFFWTLDYPALSLVVILPVIAVIAVGYSKTKRK